ncbi:beta-lactamase/transpeptidase-like protein [Thozetella sp. PMI_491]|nr:beta-lactamase/transpeptidase-like protein [Thozetella sp. PMI_491]
MVAPHTTLVSTGLLASLTGLALAAYQPCPLLTAYFPPPTIDKTSQEIESLSTLFSSVFDDLVRTGSSDDFGTITPNTTSFSVVMFSGASDAAEESIFFEYSYTAPSADASINVTADTSFPVGSLTQLFTDYLWLVEIGDAEWQTPITKFVPELSSYNASCGTLRVPWNVVTIGSLAGHMSGITRDSNACELGLPCDRQKFLDVVSGAPPNFLPDTTPIVSNAAFQLLALALSEASSASHGKDFAEIMSTSIFQPLGMTGSSVLGSNNTSDIFAGGLGSGVLGEPASLGLVSTTADLARAGNAILSSKLTSSSVTRRWLQPIADTSNLRNGVGRPWEIYHAGKYTNSSILDVYTKSGTVGPYASYFGVSTDFNAGFAILAHDTTGKAPDLNVYADIVSYALDELVVVTIQQMAERFAGAYGSTTDGSNLAVFNVTREPGLVVQSLVVNNTDLRLEAAKAAGIELANLDFKLYPTNVMSKTQHQFVTVLQDKTAPVDQDTPTCITWMDAGSLPGTVDRAVFQLDEQGKATSVKLTTRGQSLGRIQ